MGEREEAEGKIEIWKELEALRAHFSPSLLPPGASRKMSDCSARSPRQRRVVGGGGAAAAPAELFGRVDGGRGGGRFPRLPHGGISSPASIKKGFRFGPRKANLRAAAAEKTA
jgi:hypothetical protein